MTGRPAMKLSPQINILVIFLRYLHIHEHES